MIISETRAFVFIHNPKCGGTTARSALMKFDTTKNFFWLYHDVNELKIDKAHMPMYLFRRLFTDYFKLLESSFVFMMVREPYQRTISAFNETHRDLLEAIAKSDDKQQATNAYKNALNGFIGQIRPQDISGWHFKFRHFVRQYDMAYIGAKNMTDLIIKLETWPAGLDKLAAFDPELRKALLNAHNHNVNEVSVDPMVLLTPASIKKINEIYRDDFLVFDYPMVQ